MKMRKYVLAAGICLLLTGCAESRRDPIINVETSPLKKQQTTAAETVGTERTAAPETTARATTTVTTTAPAPAKPYQWVKEPFLSADDINVVAAENANANYGDYLDTDFALIIRGDLLGMVDYDGNVVMEPKYKAVRGMLDSEHAHYDFQTEPSPAGTSQVFCVKSRKFVAYEEPVCPECGEMFSTCYFGTDYVYEIEQKYAGIYASDVLHTAENGDELWLHGQIGFERKDDLTDTVVARSITLPQDYLTDLSAKGSIAGGFGLIRNNEVILSFDYPYALDFKEGAAALCKDEKWGYVDAGGNTVIPFEYDADMIYSYDPNRYIPNFGDDGKDLYVPYLPCGGYIALNKGDQAGYCDPEGGEKVPVGEFMAARPVHEGKAWVQDADTKLWGIISLK
ncbi:MAG: WG repeat-containing protein [Oscillospiraceae bacterium]|nr:WG repeat-containing protein [Oscillospiraceae bacterium]